MYNTKQKWQLTLVSNAIPSSLQGEIFTMEEFYKFKEGEDVVQSDSE